PLDVEGDFLRPTSVSRGHGAAVALIDLREGGVGQTKLEIKLVQVVVDCRIVVGIHNGDGGAAAISSRAVEADLIEAVGMADLRGRIACAAGCGPRRYVTGMTRKVPG